MQKDIDGIIKLFYNINDKDPQLRYEWLKTYRSDIIRVSVISLHLAIEDILKGLLIESLKQNKVYKVRELKEFINKMESSKIVVWAGLLGLINREEHSKLKKLNEIRNRLAHNWLIDIPKYKRNNKTKKIKKFRWFPIREKIC